MPPQAILNSGSILNVPAVIIQYASDDVLAVTAATP
jgi:hypothetical protein